MSTEIELKLQLDPDDVDKLSHHPLLADVPHKTQVLLNTYFDTPALDLHARKIALRFRKKGEEWLCTIKTAEPATGGLARRSEWEVAARPGNFDFSHVDAPELRRMLESMRGSFEPVFTTDFTRKTWLLAFGGSTVEFAIDSGFVESRGRKAQICEIELELVSGKIADLFALSQQLQTDFDLRPALASKAERGYALFLGLPPQPFPAQRPDISTGKPARQAFCEHAFACLEIFQRNETGIREGNESEFIEPACQAAKWLAESLALPPGVSGTEGLLSRYAARWAEVARMLASGRTDDIRSLLRGKELASLILAFTADLYTLEARDE